MHTFCAVAAIATGALVIVSRKGTRKHRLIGFSYVATMLLTNLTALFTQSLYQFGPFHWMALASLLTVCAGVSAPLFFRHKPNWLMLHYEVMLWSYVGLIAAMFAEIAVRIPAIGQVVGGSQVFWGLVISASALTFVIGGVLIGRHKKRFFG
ncbi:DUF2306 domain-containing protein [Alteromonas ponticola]|uniref:DUF2306 domain-containing protein n=1 Tax=Alteromonas ponticola TaxID=2720613 RepID=UPI0031B57C48